MQVVESQEIWRTGIVRPRDRATVVLQLDLVGANAGELVERILLSCGSERGHEDDGCGADHHAQHGQEEARLTGTKAVDRQPDDLAEHHGGPSALQGAVEGGRFGEIGCRHLLQRLDAFQYRSGAGFPANLATILACRRLTAYESTPRASEGGQILIVQ